MSRYLPSRNFAPYACLPEKSRGRLHKEEESVNRNAFQRDRDRIIHSTPFRRLEYKTQVFVNHEGDHYRTRLTHSLEVSQLARSICRELGLNEDLAEALALAHDLGHTPFGHAGEDALDDAMRDYGGFDHNAQAIRILTKLERRYAEFDGLNLTWETLEGIAKHNGPVTDIPRAMQAYLEEQDLEVHTWPSAEAQVAALADDIAYNNHDIDDGFRAGLLRLEMLDDLPLVGETFQEVRDRYPEASLEQWVHEAVRRIIHSMVLDIIENSALNLQAAKVKSVDDIRKLGTPVVAFSSAMREINQSLKTFLFENMYRHYKINRMASKARHVVRDLFQFFMDEPECMPTEWRRAAEKGGKQAQAVAVCDFIAGMTDRFALLEYKKVFDVEARG